MTESPTGYHSANALGAAAKVTPEMLQTGVRALAAARRDCASDEEVAAAVYLAMIPLSDSATREEALICFARETILNLRAAVEAVKSCERRAEEHWSEVLDER